MADGTRITFAQASAAGQCSVEDALALYDSLEPVDTDFMIGAWAGRGFPTGHPLDGGLESAHWHGKRFDSAEKVHPLVFRTRSGGTVSVNPTLAMLGMPLARSKLAGAAFQWLLPLVATQTSGARLRVTRYRGKDSATMIYDRLPINDVFRKVDANTVLGIMDFKGMRQPFFFVLAREHG